jgi:hypothetical protein
MVYGSAAIFLRPGERLKSTFQAHLPGELPRGRFAKACPRKIRLEAAWPALSIAVSRIIAFQNPEEKLSPS